ncbi:MAG: tetratricopeptide repeat protein [Elusimicrobia bacterium]|nr:tetratricopeptide repeat protein [Elusimicrobiota bacterium]
MAETLLDKGITLYNLRRFAEAIRAFEEAVRRGAPGEKATCFLAHAWASSGDLPRAVRILEDRILASREPAPLVETMRKILASKGMSAPQAMLMSAERSIQAGDLAQAEALLRAALLQDPRLARAHVMLAVVLEAMKLPAQARAEYEEALRLDSSSSGVCLGLGELLLREGDSAGAEARLREALRMDPASVQAHFALGQALCARGEPDAGRREYEEALRLDGAHEGAHLMLGELLLAAEEFGRAGEHLSSATRGPRAADAFFLLGKAREGAGRPAEARQAYEEALRLDAGHAKARLSLGELALSEGRFEDAQARFAEVAEGGADEVAGVLRLAHALIRQGRFGEAAGRLEEALQRHPGDPELLFALGTAHLGGERREPMAEAFRRYVESGGGSDPATLRRRFIALMALGEYPRAFESAERLLDGGDLSEDHDTLLEPWVENPTRPHSEAFHAGRAAEMAALAAESPSRSPWPWFYRGVSLCRTGRSREGLSALDAAAGFDAERYGWMRCAGGVERLRLGLVEEAVDDLRAAVASMPSGWWARCRLAEAHAALSRDAEAMGEFSRAESACKPGVLREIRAWRGEVLLWLGRYEEALRDLDFAHAKGCGLAACWRGAARLLSGRPDEALGDLDLAIAINAADPEARVLRGELKRLTGRRAEALEDLRKAAELGNDLWADANLALLHASAGDEEAMWDSFEKLPLSVASAALRGVGRSEWRGVDAKVVRGALEALLAAGRGIRRPDRHLLPLCLRRLAVTRPPHGGASSGGADAVSSGSSL